MIRSEFQVWQDELAGKRRVSWIAIGAVVFCAVFWAAVIITLVRR